MSQMSTEMSTVFLLLCDDHVSVSCFEYCCQKWSCSISLTQHQYSDFATGWRVYRDEALLSENNSANI